MTDGTTNVCVVCVVCDVAVTWRQSITSVLGRLETGKREPTVDGGAVRARALPARVAWCVVSMTNNYDIIRVACSSCFLFTPITINHKLKAYCPPYLGPWYT